MSAIGDAKTESVAETKKKTKNFISKGVKDALQSSNEWNE